MAGVQRTRIGYGNEGRTKQLAASLSDFIRLFFSLLSSLPPTTQHNTPNLLLCPAHGGVFNRKKTSGSVLFSFFLPLLPFCERTDSRAPRIHREVSLIFITLTFYDPRFRQQQQQTNNKKKKSVSLTESVSRVWLSSRTFSATFV